MVEFNERTEFFIKDTMDDCIAEIQLTKANKKALNLSLKHLQQRRRRIP